MVFINSFPSTKTNLLAGPAALQFPPLIYQPVNCDFTDELEYCCIYKLKLNVKYYFENQNLMATSVKIKDIYTHKQEEFVLLSNNLRIRLDHLVSLEIILDSIKETEVDSCIEGACSIKKR